MAKMNNKKNALTARGNARAQTFSLTAPAATSVQLVGSFTHWLEKPITLQKGAEGVWQTTVELEPGTHSYRFS